MKNKITITKTDFELAIKTVIEKSMANPHFSHPESTMLYTLGGSVFAREVMRILFGEEEDT